MAVAGEGSQVVITKEELLMLKKAAEEGQGLASEKRKRDDEELADTLGKRFQAHILLWPTNIGAVLDVPCIGPLL